MKKYFVCSDIHSYFDEWISSLNEAGYQKDNSEHILIILGDLFDRGKKPWEIYQFISSLPEDRVVLIKGNHEYLLLELVKRKFPYDYDFSNGTYDTLIHLYKDPRKARKDWIKRHSSKNTSDDSEIFFASYEYYQKVEKRLYDNPKINVLVDWINSSRWLNYYELGQYIFVHSFIPLKGVDNIYSMNSKGEYYQNWRNETDPKRWEMATWGCPYQRYLDGNFVEELKKGKILVCGHWHTSDFFNKLLYYGQQHMDYRKENPIFRSANYPGLIAIDACTAATHKANVLVINEEELV